MSPKVLILHASIGGGHKSAANALQQAFAQRGVTDVVVKDVFEFGGELLRKAVVGSYTVTSEKAPLLWKMFYESGDVSDPKRAKFKNQLRGQAQRPMFVLTLDKFVKEYNPDILIGTHFMPLEILLPLKRKGEITAPLYEVITDFMVSSDWIQNGVDAYFVASQFTREAMIARGVDTDLIHVTGIPVRPELAIEKTREEARANVGLQTEHVITLLGGGIDSKRVRFVAAELLKADMRGALVVVAGRNKELLEEIQDLQNGATLRLLKLGFIDYLDDLIVASDVVITKAGGLTVSEILARGTPMIVIDPIPGQEEWNADYVAASGAGIQLRMIETAPAATIALLSAPDRLAAMRTRAKQVGKPRAALEIVEATLKNLTSA
ncbi:glycosyltransferase [Anaerolineae bacterium CFX7]|nr:glycosyltransferase [Anaerolineae bacterium CFX7]